MRVRPIPVAGIRKAYRPIAFAGALVVLLTNQAVAQNPNARLCPPLAFNALNAPSWEDDTGYELTVRDLGGGNLRITVVGDILVLDKARFGSLLRGVDKAPANVAEVVLDGREVRITEPLALQSGRIRIVAQTVSFTGRGLVALTRPPGQATDGLEINAQRVDLSKALPLPLQLTLADDGQRSVVVRTAELITPQGPLTGDPAKRWLWTRSSNYDGAMPDRWPGQWTVSVGPVGYAEAVQTMSPMVGWPGYMAFKLRKHYAIAPFDQVNRARLAQQIDAARPLFVELQQADPLLQLDALALLMQRNLDDRGLGPAHVPSEDFVQASERFSKALAAANNQLPRLRTLIVSAHLAPKLDEEMLKQVRSRIQSLDQEQAQRRAKIDDTLTEIASLQAQGVEVGKRIEEEREESRRELERRKKQQKDLEGIKLGTTVLAIGASFIGTPAAGAAIAATVSTAGDFVYAHNAGAPVNLETLVTIGKKNADLYDTLKATRVAWDKHSKDLDVLKDVLNGKKVVPEGAKKPLAKIDAAKQAGESAAAFGRSVKAVSDGLGAIPKPDAVTLNEIEAGNGDLVAALGRLATIQQSIAEAAARLDQLQAAQAAGEAAWAETRNTEQVLLELKPTNDQEVMRWKTAALQMWTRELQRLYGDARSLRRSLFFETWKIPVLPATVQTYPEEFTAYLASGRYSPEAPNSTSPSALTAAHLDNEIAKHLAVLEELSRAINQSWQSYLAERASGAQPFFDQQEFERRDGAPITTRMFLDALNAQIKYQIQYPASRESKRFPLLIPFEMTSPPDINLPERLLRAGVANVRFKNVQALTGKTLAFDVTYRLAGELKRGEQCAYVDLSVPGGAGTVTRRDQARELTVVRGEAEQPMSFNALRESRTAPPARTLYFLSVIVGGSSTDANWANVPEIEGFTFWRRIVQ